MISYSIIIGNKEYKQGDTVTWGEFYEKGDYCPDITTESIETPQVCYNSDAKITINTISKLPDLEAAIIEYSLLKQNNKYFMIKKGYSPQNSDLEV